MPARAKSLQITDRYRSEMIRLRQQGQREAKRIWRSVSPDNLDGTFNVGLLEMTVSTLQKEAARLSSAYLSAFIASELGEAQRPPALSVWDKTFNGNPLREGLRSAVIKAKMAIKDGQDPAQATNDSRDILVSDVGLFIDTAARESLRQGMEMDDRIVGYQRAVKGTCGACSGDTQYEAFSPNAPVVPLNVHPNCECVAEPVVTATKDPLPSRKAEQFLEARQAPIRGGLRDSLEDYQGSGAYWVNNLLRGADVTTLGGWELADRTVDGVRMLARRIDEIFTKTPRLGRSMQLWRGLGGKPSDFGLREGYTLTDLGFGSASTREGVAKNVAEVGARVRRGGTVLELTVHPDVKVLWMNRAFPEDLFWKGEKEALLQRGCRYVIQEVKGNRVKVVVLPPP